MSAGEMAGNLAAYSLQVAALAGAGLLAPRLVRLRSPRALHLFYRAVLAGCLALPLLQPWRARTAPASAEWTFRATGATQTGAGDAAHNLPELILAVCAAGVAVRWARLALGLNALGRLRRSAAELRHLPRPVANACLRTGTTARFFVSSELGSPATFGIRCPTVLLPDRFFQLRPELQEAIVRHELVHVQRRDWASTVGEEVVRALFWFHPVVWLLIDRIRLTREQVVDRVAAGADASRKTYAEALVAVAADLGRAPAAAAAFAAEHHLALRVSSLLKEVPMSKSRLVLSLVLAAGTAASAAVSAGRYFPFDLTASPAIADVETPKSARVSGAAKKATLTKKDSGSLVAEDPIYKIADGITAPKLVSKTEPKYTQQARDEKIQGTVVLEAVISAKGVAEQIKVLESLDAGLDKNAVDAVGHWVFEPGMKDGKPVRVRARIEVNFKLK